MNLSKAFPQSNWSGATPFEVCHAPGGTKPRVSCSGVGALAKGGDLKVANVSLRDATAWCSAQPKCVGFTARASGCGDVEGVRHVYFKEAVAGHNPDAAWVTFLKKSPCGYDSETDGWAPPASTELKGDTIVLGSVDPATAIAVRSHWRIYPCEQCAGVTRTAALAAQHHYSVMPGFEPAYNHCLCDGVAVSAVASTRKRRACRRHRSTRCSEDMDAAHGHLHTETLGTRGTRCTDIMRDPEGIFPRKRS